LTPIKTLVGGSGGKVIGSMGGGLIRANEVRYETGEM